MIDEFAIRGKKVVQAGADDDLTDRLRDAATDSLYVFAKAICGMSKFTPGLHRPLCDDFLMDVHHTRRKAALWPRDTFKTSIARCLGLFMVIQPAAYNPFFPGIDGCNLRIAYAAETEKRALTRIGWIRRQCENNQLFRALWPDICPWENPRTEAPGGWAASRFTINRYEDYTEGTFEALGVDSGSTGSHYDIVIKDDLIGLRSRQDPQLMVRAIEWFQASHSLNNDPQLSIEFIFGTRWAAYDLYSWMEENEPEFGWDVKQIINDDFDESSILFPERFTITKILELQRMGELFWLNYMNKAVGEGTTAFNVSKAQFFKFTDEGDIEVSDSAKTQQILGIIAKSREPVEQPKIKRIWELTPQERTEVWLDMQRNWYAQKLSQIELS